MSKEPESSNIGEVSQDSYECETITWKIPNVSILEITEDTEVRSPWFSYKQATWILKMHPCGGTNFSGKQSLRIQLERLHSDVPVHEFLYAICFHVRGSFSDSNNYKSLVFNFNSQQNIMFTDLFDGKWYLNFYHNSAYRFNDTIGLVVKILIKKNAAFGLDSKTKSPETALGSKFTKNEESLKSTGELSVESFDVDAVAWKIPKIHSIPVKVDSKVQGPVFSFAGAKWIFKLFIYGQTRFNSEKKVDMVLERLQSHIRKQPILYEIFVKSNDEKKFLLQADKCIGTLDSRGFFVFDSDHPEENIIELISYENILRCAGSNQQFGTIAIIGIFQTPKKSEIQFYDQMESVQPVVASSKEIPGKIPVPVASTSKDLLELSRNSEKPEVGEIITKTFECEVISWRIPNVSALLTSKDNGVQSPLFSYKGVTLKLKMYPNKTGHFEVVIERLTSQSPVHKVVYKCFFKAEGRAYGTPFFFNSSHEPASFHLYWHIYDLYKNYRHNDTLTLVCEIYSKKNSEIEMDLNTKSSEEGLGSRNTLNYDSCKLVGELVAESFDVEVIAWKIPKLRSITVEVDSGVRSPLFSFAGAFWLLTMFPYGQKKFQSEGKVDLVIDRVCSPFPKHPVSYAIFFKAYDKEFDEKGYSLEDFAKTSYKRENSFIFEANNTRENICCVNSFIDLLASNLPCDTTFLICELRTKSSTGKRLEILSKSLQSDTGSSQATPKELSTPATSCKGSSQETSKHSFPQFGAPVFSSQGLSQETPKHFFPQFGAPIFSSQGSSQETTKHSIPQFGDPVFSSQGSFQETSKHFFPQFGPPVFSFQGSSQKTSKEEPVAPLPVFSFKGSSSKKTSKRDSFTPTGSSQKTSKEQSFPSFGAFAFSFKGHNDEPRESVELPSKKFLSDMKELFRKQEDCDVILKVKGQEFPAHRLILKSRSPVFASTFKYDTKEKSTGIIDIEDCDPSSISDFLYFLYCGSAEKISAENVFSLFTVADKYEVLDLRSECVKFMKRNLSIDNVCDTIALALKHFEKELIELTTDFFTKNLQKIILTVKWQSFLVENPIQGNELLIKALSLNK